MNFENIDYLQFGTARQRKADSVLVNNNVFSKLKRFDPILAGTIPINIDIENSDLDIICYFLDKQEFQETIVDNFGTEKNFIIRERLISGTLSIVANCFIEEFEIEIFGQNIPTKQQFAYRHLVVEHNLLMKHGDKLRQQIIELKRQGYKTEPAFALALGLTGDPYIELLKFESQ
ncbi:DUF4269 domain-containing protein [Desertivirga arenae]|uniref:DUF4269 domain-containing protein n=1 Tax=Desertivirga arenae TaxID=2810309 RepID=UPI001A97D2DE|nr:DUF4269 domain-containing protein [Pedobacter sp. SYSU D00823]